MNRFRYPLESLLRLKRSLLEQEQTKLQELAVALDHIDRRRAALLTESESASRTFAESTSAEGWQLAALGHFHRYAVEENGRLIRARTEMCGRIEEQRLRVVQSNKKVRILEVLKEKKLSAWHDEARREQEQLVAELVVAQWNSRRENS